MVTTRTIAGAQRAIELPLQPLPATNGALLGYVQAKQGQKQPTATPATTPVAIWL